MKIEYVVLSGDFADPVEEVADVITWDDLDEPTYETGRARELVEGKTRVLTGGARAARSMLGAAAGWSNGYVLTRRV